MSATRGAGIQSQIMSDKKMRPHEFLSTCSNSILKFVVCQYFEAQTQISSTKLLNPKMKTANDASLNTNFCPSHRLLKRCVSNRKWPTTQVTGWTVDSIYLDWSRPQNEILDWVPNPNPGSASNSRKLILNEPDPGLVPPGLIHINAALTIPSGYLQRQ